MLKRNEHNHGKFLLIFLLWLVLLPGACRPEDDSWQRVQQRGVLLVGLDPTYPPFAVADENGLTGFDVDLANKLAADLGLETQFVLFGYDGLYDALETGQVDVLISALVIVPERTRDFAYSDPYFNAGEVLITRQGNAGQLQAMADLNGRTLAVELGALGHVEALEWAKKVADLTVTPFTTADEALTAVADGEADAALVDAISGHLFLKEQQTLVFSDRAVTVEPFAIVSRIEDELLLEQINNSLAHLQETGQFREIQERWLGP